MRAKVALRLAQEGQTQQNQQEAPQRVASPVEVLNACLSHPLTWGLIPLVLPLAAFQRTAEVLNQDPDADLTPREASILAWIQEKNKDGKFIWLKSQRSEVIREANKARIRELEERAKQPLTKIHI